MTIFGTRLKAERQRLGLTQVEMANVGGVHPNSQSAYENGGSSPTAEYLERVIARGVDSQFLFHGEYANSTVSTQVAELLAILVQLPPEQQATCFAMLSLFRRSTTSIQASAEQANDTWRAARLFEHFLNTSQQHKTLIECAAGLDKSPPEKM